MYRRNAPSKKVNPKIILSTFVFQILLSMTIVYTIAEIFTVRHKQTLLTPYGLIFYANLSYLLFDWFRSKRLELIPPESGTDNTSKILWKFYASIISCFTEMLLGILAIMLTKWILYFLTEKGNMTETVMLFVFWLRVLCIF